VTLKLRARHWWLSFQFGSIATIVGMFMLGWAGLSAYQYWQASSEQTSWADYELKLGAEAALSGFPPSLVESAPSVELNLPKRVNALPNGTPATEQFNFQVWRLADRRLVSRAGDSTPNQPLNASFKPGFSSSRVNGQDWYVYSTSDAQNQVQVQAGYSQAQRQALAKFVSNSTLNTVVLPMMLAVSVALLAVGFWSGAPLRRLRLSVEQRRPDDATPLPTHNLPSEVVPLVLTFNEMLLRAERSRQTQQRFVSDAAHELRTPLAALRIQAQVVQGAVDESARKEALQRLVQGIDRSTRVAEQLLDLARVDHLRAADQAPKLVPVALAELGAAVADGVMRVAQSRQVTLDTTALQGSVQTDAGLLCVALRNLVDNALRYSPPGSRVVVTSRQSLAGFQLSVIDQGPGIAAAERALAMQPFVRLGDNDEVGSGLGLPLVVSVCRLIGTTFELHDVPGAKGLEARLVWPAPR
jgi:two-component system, OmpR family, sensor histidine kinase QseC